MASDETVDGSGFPSARVAGRWGVVGSEAGVAGRRAVVASEAGVAGRRAVVASEAGVMGRRAMVSSAAGVAAAAALGAVAACSAAGDPGTGESATPGVPAAPGPPPDPAAGSGGRGTRLGPASEVPVGGGKIYPNFEVVITQPTAGDYRGFTAICTHTGCDVTEVADGTIDCPCHGSRFHLDGTVARGPAPSALQARAVKVVDGQVVLS